MPTFSVNYSTLSANALLQLVSEHYETGTEASITFLKRGFNDTYLVNTNREKYVLRVYKHNWRSLESIETETRLLIHLHENSIPVSYPIKDKHAQYIQAIDAPEGLRHAVLFSYAPGQQIRKLTTEQAFLLGSETGRIHNLTSNKSFGQVAHNYSIEVQFEITLNVLKTVLTDYPEQYAYLEHLKNEFMDLFKGLDQKELSRGICHGDLQAENFHITEGNKFTFFDFDFFGEGFLAYDIGVFRWYDHKNKTPQIMDAFLEGYQTQRKLSETEIKLIPWFSTLRALFQMTLYCKISDGKQLPLWPAQQVSEFINKVKKWQSI
ncbi:MAG: phosphotransferase [Bacteroidia bacterium]